MLFIDQLKDTVYKKISMDCFVRNSDEPFSSSLQLREEYLAGMLYEQDSHLSYRAV
jgi:hypothetical protein